MMRIGAVLIGILLAGCADPTAPSPDATPDVQADPVQPAVDDRATPSLEPTTERNVTSKATFEGCTGSDPGPLFPLRALPWAAPEGYDRPLGVVGEAKLIAYQCDKVDIFGLETASDVLFAVEAHTNASDPQGHFDVRFNRLEMGLQFYTNHPVLQEALAWHGVETRNATFRADKSAMTLASSGGMVSLEFIQEEVGPPGAVEVDYLLVGSVDPPVGLLMDLHIVQPYQSIATKMTATGDMRLAESVFLEQGTITGFGLQIGSSFTLEVIKP